MNFIIFGAGVIGIKALEFLGSDRVICFADNYKAGQAVEAMLGQVTVEKDIVSFPDMMELCETDNHIIVVASGNYSEELTDQVKKTGYKRVFTFKESDAWRIWSEFPFYRLYRRWESVTYTRRLAEHRIGRYKRIAILGSNEFLPYLISAIALQVGFECIIGVVDTIEAHDVNLLGVPIISWDETKTNADCVVVNSRREDTYYCEELEEKGFSFYVLKLYDVEQEMPVFFHPELSRLKDIHKGGRCFILGNGPSLTTKDLEVLHKNKEICFGCNKVYRVYPKTEWRADYLVVSDFNAIEDIKKDGVDKIQGIKFMSDQIHRTNDSLVEGFELVHMYEELYYPNNYPRFSNDITKGVYMGFTVIYDMSLQIAAYMGFKEMYILGVDLSYLEKRDNKKNYFIDDYIKKEEEHRYDNVVYDVNIYQMIRAFEKAEKYSRQHGFRIYNATRGGNLEAFERVKFDELFK